MRIRPVIRIGPFVITSGGRRALAPRPGRVRLRASDYVLLAGAVIMLTIMIGGAAMAG